MAPLDWGLGHATRCVPIVKELLNAGFKVIIAAEGDQKILLQEEFPNLEIVYLKGYRLKYGSTKLFTILKIIIQIPKILISINRENKWLGNIINIKHLDAVIADNRFGLHNRKIISVFITHQLCIKTSLGKVADRLVQKMNYYFINRFNYCWVPDLAGEKNLAGALSHPVLQPRTEILYTGFLSRITKQPLPLTNQLLILLSGPEPQRSIFERLLLQQLNNYIHPVILVRGLPGAVDNISATPLLTIYNYLSGPALQRIINQSGIIISRSGYSTIMDVLPKGKKCILIPTPGQAEQEYLANYLAGTNYACTGVQHNFNLTELIANAETIEVPGFLLSAGTNETAHAIAVLLSCLNKKQ